ncbi:MAG: DNA polymerase III subunit gamma/tau [Betaproteobacteria bacterium]
MSYQVLARKWRPRDFASLVGQEHVVKALQHALTENRLHHAYLFTGTRGVGKTTLARILAKCLNCEQGVSPVPCGNCGACLEIDGGRFVDLLEVDAATNTRVDEMRQLLDTAQYAPTRGRYKVYVIDEVHQLSGHAFNAMLKTLEEPPEHLKFILATTDPQKIPVTVLSRCLQFNLKQMPRGAIAGHLARVLEAEKIAFEPEALPLVAQAAAGSMRDALSLLDQAIAHGAGKVAAEGVRAMLGTIDEGYLLRLLDAVAAGEGTAVMAVADEMQARSLSFDAALQDLAALLLRLSLAQLVPEALEADYPDRDRVVALAGRFDPELTQLLYQIALQGRSDLPLAPDEHAGFAMTLLRMLAFRTEGAQAKPAPAPAGTNAPAPGPASLSPPRPAAASQPFGGDWAALARELPLSGAPKQLAHNAELQSFADSMVDLVIPRGMAYLAGNAYRDKLQAALEQHLGRPMRVKVSVGETSGASVAAKEADARAARQSEAARTMKGDRFVQDLVNMFDGKVIEPSVRPAPPAKSE